MTRVHCFYARCKFNGPESNCSRDNIHLTETGDPSCFDYEKLPPKPRMEVPNLIKQLVEEGMEEKETFFGRSVVDIIKEEEVKKMTTVRCSFHKCIHNERSRCSNQLVNLDIIEGSEHFKCLEAAIPTKRMEVPTTDLVTYPLSVLSEERGKIIKALDDDIWVDEDHWWRSCMYARLAAIELFIHAYEESME